MTLKLLPLAVAASLSSLGLSGGEPEAAGATDLSKVTLGEHWYGPDLEMEDLEGRVVLLEFWGFK